MKDQDTTGVRYRHRGIDWDAQPLGEVPDRDLAERLGVDTSAVGSARRRRGIQPVPASRRLQVSGIDWDVQPFGKEPDIAIARRLRCHRATVSYQRNSRGIPPWKASRQIEWDSVDGLGTVPDVVLGERVGASTGAAGNARRRRTRERGPGGPLGIEWDKQPLGEQSDSSIARSLGCTAGAVWRARQSRGIPAHLDSQSSSRVGIS